jgi:iron complex outermembrane recepter protein
MKPEESKQMEAGVKITTNNGLTGTFAVFDIRRRNVPISNGGFGSVQSGEQQAKGFEADILWQPNRNLSLLASYAYTDAKVVEDNNPALVGAPLTGVPKNSGRLWANYTFVDGAWKGLSFGAGVYAASEQVVELGAVWRTPGYATLEAKIAYQYEGWNMALIGRNLTDRQYFVPYQYLSGRVAPGDGRTVFASASRKF